MWRRTKGKSICNEDSVGNAESRSGKGDGEKSNNNGGNDDGGSNNGNGNTVLALGHATIHSTKGKL